MKVEPARGAAFAPGHITGIFEIHDTEAELAKRGSRGAGFSVSEGALTYVEIEPADKMEIEIRVDNELSDAPVTRDAVIRFLKLAVRDARVPLNADAPKGSRAQIRVHVHTQLGLPVSQGFGMSAAGALSATIALAKCLRMGRSDAVLCAHEADVAQRGGLGDVMGASVGGFEIRLSPGVPPHGHTTSFLGFGQAVLCVIGGPLETRAVLSDPARRETVNKAGAAGMKRLLEEPSMDNFLDVSSKFARDSGLLTDRLADAIDACRPHGKASMSMLGNSVFAFGNVPRLVEALEPFGKVYVMPIDDGGARRAEIQGAANP